MSIRQPAGVLLFILAFSTAFASQPKGKLYIIGGGKRPQAMADELAKLAKLDHPESYAYIMTMATSEKIQDYEEKKAQLTRAGAKNVIWFDVPDGNAISQQTYDSIVNASLIFMAGGDQNVFMNIVRSTKTHEAILKAYHRGAVIAGTSAGAAVQSKKMITGNRLLRPEDESGYRTIEAKNIELAEGLGLLDHAIIDQHFIYRQRLNRLISVALENPGDMCIGIDESTAILVEGKRAKVRGISQVVVIENTHAPTVKGSLIGGKGLRLSIYLPDEEFELR